MSLADPLVLKSAAGTDISFAVTGPVSDKGSIGTVRVDTSSDASEPRALTIKQSVTGKGALRVRRTLVQYTSVKVNDLGVQSQLTLNLSWVYPLNGEFSASDLDDAICFVADALLTTGSLAVDSTKRNALLQGQS